VTVEALLEHLHPKKVALMTQREVGTHTAGAAAAIRAALRQDPDVIVVGDLSDAEAVKQAVVASEAGCLVLGTMNTLGPVRALDRILELLRAEDGAHAGARLAAVLRLVVSQRLVAARDGKSVHVAFGAIPWSPALASAIRDGKGAQIQSLQAPGVLRLDNSLAALVVDDRVAPDAARSAAESPGEFDAVVVAQRLARRQGA
jgi:twitching motility protein PilT